MQSRPHARGNPTEPPNLTKETNQTHQTSNIAPTDNHSVAWEVLELQYPDHLECYHCRTLHPLENIHHYSTAARHKFSQDPCWRWDIKSRTPKFIHPNFNFTFFRMLMKRYRQGERCDKLLELLAYRSKPTIERSWVKQIVATPKIVDGKLLMRTQTAYTVPPQKSFGSLNYLMDRNFLKCVHSWPFGRFRRDNKRLTRILFPKLSEPRSIQSQEDIMSCRCEFCPTDFQCSLHRYGKEEVLLYITRWQDLGTGLSPTDLSPLVGPRGIIDHIRGAQTHKTLVYESPRERFQDRAGCPDKSFEGFSEFGDEQRKEIFAMSNSCQAKLMMVKDEISWKIFGSSQPAPHITEC